MKPRMTNPVVELRISGPLPPDFPAGRGLESCISQSLRLILDELGPGCLPGPIELGVTVLNDPEMRAMNLRQRGVDGATDVLSFPLLDSLEELGNSTPDGPPVLLGDIVLDSETIARQANERGLGFAERFAECLTHGILHLLGYDHEKETDRIKMEDREEVLAPQVATILLDNGAEGFESGGGDNCR